MALSIVFEAAGADAQAEVQSIAKALKEHVKAILQNRSVILQVVLFQMQEASRNILFL